MGSSIGVKLYLEKLGHKVDIILPSEFPSILTFLPRTDNIVIFDFEKERSLELIKRCQLMFFLDFSSLDRIDALGEHVISKNVPKIHIDHHLDPEPLQISLFQMYHQVRLQNLSSGFSDCLIIAFTLMKK